MWNVTQLVKVRSRISHFGVLFKGAWPRIVNSSSGAGRLVTKVWIRLRFIARWAWPGLTHILASVAQAIPRVRLRIRPLTNLLGSISIVMMIPGIVALGHQFLSWLMDAGGKAITLQQGWVWLLSKVVTLFKILDLPSAQERAGCWLVDARHYVPENSLLRKTPLSSCLLLGLLGLLLSELLAGSPKPSTDDSKSDSS